MTNVECRLTNCGIASLNLFKISVRQKTHDEQNTLFDVRCWAFDAYSPPWEDSAFNSFYFDLNGRLFDKRQR